ncbi:MAG: hypothetical protein WCE63_12910 [Acidobacteriaceae bacterium]
MKPASEYLQREALLKAVATAGIDVLQVRTLLWYIDAFPSLTYFAQAVRNLDRVISAADQTWPGMLEELQIAFLRPLLSSLIPIADSIVFPPTPADENGRPEWLSDQSGWVTRNPFYFALCELPPEDTNYSKACCLLMAHVFLAHLAILWHPNLVESSECDCKRDSSLQSYEAYGDAQPWAALRIPCRHAGIALRNLCSGQDWARAVVAKFPLAQRPKIFARTELDPIDDASISPFDKPRRWLEDRVDYILNYVRQAYGLERRRRGNGSSGRKSNDRDRAVKRLQPVATPLPREAKVAPYDGPRRDGPSCSPEASERAVIVTETSDKPVPENRKSEPTEEWYRYDECPDEDADLDDEELEAGDEGQGHDVKGGKHRSRKGRADTAASDRNQAKRASKAFAFAFDRLAACEIVPLEVHARNRLNQLFKEIAECSSMSERKPDGPTFPEALLDEAELIVFLLVMLWTGSDVERARSLRISTSFECSAPVPLAVLMSKENSGRDAVFRVQSPFPHYQTSSEPWITCDRERTEYVLLEDPAELGPLLWKFAEFQNEYSAKIEDPHQTLDDGAIQCLVNTSDYYSTHLAQMLEQWDTTGRLDLSKTENTLYGAVMSWSGKDIIATTMITGRYKPQARVPMYYACRQMEVLQAIHTGTVRDLRFRILQESLCTGSGPGEAIASLDGLFAHVRRLAPPSQIDPAPHGALYIGIRRCPTDSDLQSAVHALIGELECSRASSQPDRWVQFTNLYTFFTVWYFGFCTGCRPIEDPYLYQKDISPLNLTGSLKDKSDEKARMIWTDGGLYTHMGLYETYLQSTRLRYERAHPCWFLTDDGAPLVVRPSTVEPILHRFLAGFASNFHRRWMLNALLDSGCPPECVRAWSGHATAGNEFWGDGATASYRQIGSVLLMYRTPILEFLGFKPIQGSDL